MGRSLFRSRWAAIGAAVAVVLGAGGLTGAQAAGSTEAVFVPVTPTRVLDTRSDVGLAGRFQGQTARTLEVTGTVATIDGVVKTSKVVVPEGATAIVANLTAVGPTSKGYVAIRPGDATGVPATSNINIPAAGVNIPNSVTVAIPTSGPNAGKVNLYYSSLGNSTDLLLDIVGYYTTSSAPTRTSPERVIWVADDGSGDFTLLTDAVASITDSGPERQYVIRVAPGVYVEPAPVVIESEYVDIEGSGRDVTIIRCESTDCSTTVDGPENATIAVLGSAEIRHLSVENAGGSAWTYGVYADSGSSVTLVDVRVDGANADNTGAAVYSQSAAVELRDVSAGFSAGNYIFGISTSFSQVVMTNVAAVADGARTLAAAIQNEGGGVTMTDVAASANGLGTALSQAVGVYNYDGSHTMRNVDATAGNADTGQAVLNVYADVEMFDVSAQATGAKFAYGVFVFESTITATDLRATAFDASDFNYAVYVDSDSAGTLRRIEAVGVETAGSTWALRSFSANLKIADSMFVGAFSPGPTTTCIGNYDADLAPLSCPGS